MDYTIRGIPNEMVEKVWRFAEPFIKRALDHTFGELSHTDVRNMVLSRDMQLWMISKGARIVGAGTTQLIHYPQMEAVRIVTLAGAEFDAWYEMAHNVIRAWGNENGATAIECYVRKGFVPKLKDMGYKHRYSVVHMDI